jgi:integrase
MNSGACGLMTTIRPWLARPPRPRHASPRLAGSRSRNAPKPTSQHIVRVGALSGRRRTIRRLADLADSALAILNALPRSGPRVFPVDTVTVWRVVKRLRSGITVHGFRSTFRDWAGERTSFAHEVVEQCLAHAAGDQTELAYRRGGALKKRRQVMDAWARFCALLSPGRIGIG